MIYTGFVVDLVDKDGSWPSHTKDFDKVANCKLKDIENQLIGLSGASAFHAWKRKIMQFYYSSNSNHNVQNIHCVDALYSYWSNARIPVHIESCWPDQSRRHRHSSCGGGIVIQPVVSNFIPSCGGIQSDETDN